jgi:hypothetical protein
MLTPRPQNGSRLAIHGVLAVEFPSKMDGSVRLERQAKMNFVARVPFEFGKQPRR